MPPRRTPERWVRAAWASRIALTLILAGPASLPARTPDAATAAAGISQPSSSRPLAPEYRIRRDGSVMLRICFNWSCASRQQLDFTAQDMREVAQHMDMCPRDDQEQRLQRLRIGVWRMEALAQKYQPLLANDEAINNRDQDREGRMDCIDNASNTTTYLHVLHELGLLKGWSPAPPQVRDVFSMSVHWTAVAIDRERDEAWSVDTWYRPNAHLPFVMPLTSWKGNAIGWETPFARRNPYPRYSNQLCDTDAPRS